MEDFDKYLNADADEQERAAAEQVRKGLAGLEMEHKIASAAAARQQWLRHRFWRNMVVGLVCLVLTVIAYLLFVRRNVTPVTPPDLPPMQQLQTPTETPAVQQPPDQTPPMAQRPATPKEQSGQANLRALQPELDPETNQLIDALLKTTLDNNPAKKTKAYPSADLWRDAVAYLRQNKSAEAKKLIFQLDARGDDEARWLLGIALLEEGKPDEALAVFEKIARNTQHPRRSDAQHAVEALQ